jgi:hypothetical protein
VLNRRTYVKDVWRRLCVAALACVLLTGCEVPDSEEQILTRNTQILLMDWHVAGLWVINCPVAWVRVFNYNQVPIKEITFQYNTFTEEGQPLNEGTFTIEGSVEPQTTKNFIELYLGLVDLPSQRLTIKLLHVKRA